LSRRSSDATAHDWEPYPVIRIDLGDKQARTPDQLTTALAYAIGQNAERHSIRLKQTAASRVGPLGFTTMFVFAVATRFLWSSFPDAPG
jgi:hypothetical protein